MFCTDKWKSPAILSANSLPKSARAMNFAKLYGSLPAGYITRSTFSILLGGATTFAGYQLLLGDERFYREMVMPLVHRLSDGEQAHRLGVKMAKYGPLVGFPENRKEYPELRCPLFGRWVDNPIGLAAGFDKNGEAIDGLSVAGFGFIEIGSVTPKPQPGNERPRIFRLVKDRAVINSYGFNSDGADAVVARVEKAQTHNPSSRVARGINLGKNKTSEDAVHDYEIGVNYFAAHCDYLVINISSPNTPGLRALQAKKELIRLLDAVQEAIQRNANANSKKPQLFIKISPDLSESEMKDIAEICTDSRHFRVDGLILCNTTVQRPETLNSEDASRVGGLSGAPLRELSIKRIGEMYRLTGGKVPIIGCGGVSSGADAYEMILAGASGVQLYTALVYEGFPLVGRVKRELAELLRRDGYANVTEAIGAKNRREGNSD